MTAFLLLPNQNMAAETWIDDGITKRLGNVINPTHPTQVFHKVKVYWGPGYPTDMKITGFLASGHPYISYVGGTSARDWEQTHLAVVTDVEAGCRLNISATQGVTARAQCARIEIPNAWRFYRSVLPKAIEVKFTVN